MNDETFRWEAEIVTESTFRVFVRNMYYSNRDERMQWSMTPLDMPEYFANNKWYLKRLFKEQSGDD